MIEAITKAVIELCSECRDMADKTDNEAEAQVFKNIGYGLLEDMENIKRNTFDNLI